MEAERGKTRLRATLWPFSFSITLLGHNIQYQPAPLSKATLRHGLWNISEGSQLSRSWISSKSNIFWDNWDCPSVRLIRVFWSFTHCVDFCYRKIMANFNASCVWRWRYTENYKWLCDQSVLSLVTEKNMESIFFNMNMLCLFIETFRLMALVC